MDNIPNKETSWKELMAPDSWLYVSNKSTTVMCFFLLCVVRQQVCPFLSYLMKLPVMYQKDVTKPLSGISLLRWWDKQKLP